MIEINKEVLFTLAVIIFIFVIYIKYRWWKEGVSRKSYWIKKSVFTKTEFKFYQWLVWFFASNWLFSDYTIFSKMRLIDIFYANKIRRWYIRY